MRFPEARGREVDANQLELALLNLAVNARDAMPGGGELTAGGQRRCARERGRARAGRYVVLTVTDTGEGMDEATLAHAMEPFFTTKGVGKGTGLGLSMVHGLAAQSGGRLLLRSRKGAGTEAELWLPRAEACRRAPPSRCEARRRSRARVPSWSSTTTRWSAWRPARCWRISGTVVEADSGAEALDDPARGRRGRPDDHRLRHAGHDGARSSRRRSAARGPVCRSSSRPAMPSCRRAAASGCRCCASRLRSRVSRPRLPARSVPEPRRRLERGRRLIRALHGRGPSAHADLPLRRLPAIAVALSAALWGLWWLPLRALAEAGLTGAAVNAALYGIATAALLPLFWRRRRRLIAGGLLLLGAGGLFGAALVSWNLALGEVSRVAACSVARRSGPRCLR